ncbi:hypothetical protein VOLCADRAFT_121503 [Volvox carteri f. nagariensis]|uniref:PNPLA domain-containing protein n=1 Tax=Volvox carteri f. nagariensis TaxID=3068 RepID=D8UCA4_VOLCA|nr:uncharacterized protein VOLCADRAFT_121503 [Volvox carteri f. nagariensis]EFJ42613.1 hypothetical protein VOLCADRAFT_121503 [Volvox carteri f. nagariensis]|eukprot:XP_002956264.1 hypothetical protein VOLCADRAFT_121503 [Volvox carteri f. nagariensis]
MEGKRALPAGVMKKSKGEGGKPEAVNPDNSNLVTVFSQLADKFFEEAKMDSKAKFKAISSNKVAAVLAEFPDKITTGNLKEVAKLPGVGKGSIAKHHSSHHHHNHHNHHHPTLRLIASRIRSGSRPGARRDGARLGLVVEGGGMRGCISGAMLMALHDLGLTDVFDAIYREDLTQGTAFLDFRNLFSRESSARPVMNIDFLIDHVMHTSKPLDWDAVLTSPTPLKIVASCLDSLQPVVLSDFADQGELAEALKATAAVPRIAGPPRRLRGRTLVDAAVFEPVPLPSAIRDGCTHVLVLCTRPPSTGTGPWSRRVQHTIEVGGEQLYFHF